MKLWLDDVRVPPDDWTWCKSVPEAKALLETGTVDWASLDHDLGADCSRCYELGEQAVDVRKCNGSCDHVKRVLTLSDGWPRTIDGQRTSRGCIRRMWWARRICAQ